MNPLIITIMLVIPSPHKMVGWEVNLVPTQVQLTFEAGLQVSYNATPVPCTFRPRNKNEMVFKSPSNYCYSIDDLSSPRFVRHKNYWHKIKLGD